MQLILLVLVLVLGAPVLVAEQEVVELQPDGSQLSGSAVAPDREQCANGKGFTHTPLFMDPARESEVKCPDGFATVREEGFEITGCGINATHPVLASHVDCKCESGCCTIEGSSFAYASVYSAHGITGSPSTLAAIEADYLTSFLPGREKAETVLSAPCDQNGQAGLQWPASAPSHRDAFKFRADGKFDPSLATKDSQWFERLVVLNEQAMNTMWTPTMSQEHGWSRSCKGGAAPVDGLPVGVATFSSGADGKGNDGINCCPRSCGTKSRTDATGGSGVGGRPITVDSDATYTPGVEPADSPWFKGKPLSQGCWAKGHPNAKQERIIAPMCHWPLINGKREQPDPETHLMRISPCGKEDYPGCAMIKITRNATHVEGFVSMSSYSNPVDHPCEQRLLDVLDRSGPQCVKHFQNLSRREGKPFDACGWTLEDTMQYEFGLLHQAQQRGVFGAKEILSFHSMREVGRRWDEQLRKAVAQLRFEIGQTDTSGNSKTPKRPDPDVVCPSMPKWGEKIWSDPKFQKAEARRRMHEPTCVEECKSKDCNHIGGDIFHQCGKCSQLFKCSPGPKLCEPGCKSPCVHVKGNVVKQCGICDEGFACRPGSQGFSDANDQPHPSQENHQTRCESWCKNTECQHLNGDPMQECGACRGEFKCSPGPQDPFHHGHKPVEAEHEAQRTPATNTSSPTTLPSAAPTALPTSSSPTSSPSQVPTNTPTASETPTTLPSMAPSAKPSGAPTNTPTATPTVEPTKQPTQRPTEGPTNTPTGSPSNAPTAAPTKPMCENTAQCVALCRAKQINVKTGVACTEMQCDVEQDRCVMPMPTDRIEMLGEERGRGRGRGRSGVRARAFYFSSGHTNRAGNDEEAELGESRGRGRGRGRIQSRSTFVVATNRAGNDEEMESLLD